MEVSDPNNVKIYNLSAGKSLPDWLSDRKRRALQKKNVDIRRRIELIQEFDMPGVSTNVKMSPDGQYIIACGTYKPRIKCFDVNQLSIKFERCFDSEVVDVEILSEDYSKLVFLQCDRYVEFHSAPGRYYRLRVPKFGRSMKYHYPSAELLVVGAGSDIYRLNLERGQFLQPFTTDGTQLGACSVNTDTGLIMVGTKEGFVEAWDPRSKARVGALDVAVHVPPSDTHFPSITALSCPSGLTVAAGTATGQILLFDIRGAKPSIIKDHMYGLPIRNIAYQPEMDLYLSMDSSVLKIWERNTGKLFTSIEAKADLNDLCLVGDTGLLFMANEAPKILTYYIPSLGPAPRWCAFLDSLTEELEESKVDTLYDDYKFVTRRELEDLGLAHLLGTPLLRAYMHGFFIDIRLYKKAKAIADPFAFEKYKKRKVKEKIEQERGHRVKLAKLPTVNKDLALKLKDSNEGLLTDDRFKSMFSNPEFQIDPNSAEYRLINPVLSKGVKKAEKKAERLQALHQFTPVEEEELMKDDKSSDDSSSEDDEDLKAELKATHRAIRKEERVSQRKEAAMFELREGEEFVGLKPGVVRTSRAPLGARLGEASEPVQRTVREIRFSTKRPSRTKEMLREKNAAHHAERRKLARTTGGLVRDKPKFWKGKRVQ